MVTALLTSHGLTIRGKAGADTGFSEGGGGVMATRGGGVIGGDRPCRRKITI